MLNYQIFKSQCTERGKNFQTKSLQLSKKNNILTKYLGFSRVDIVRKLESFHFIIIFLISFLKQFSFMNLKTTVEIQLDVINVKHLVNGIVM